MAKTKEIKNYTIIVSDGKITFQMIKKGADGKYYSLSLPYPFIRVDYNAEKGQTEYIKLTHKQTEKYFLDYATKKGWLVDGNK